MKYKFFERTYDFMYGERVLWVGNALKGSQNKEGIVDQISRSFFGLNVKYRVVFEDEERPGRLIIEECNETELRRLRLDADPWSKPTVRKLGN